MMLGTLLNANYDTGLWQGDGEDHLESLTCPVVIQPDALAAALRRAEEAERERDGWKAQAEKESIWNAFHRAWTACVGTPKYDKSPWTEVSAQVAAVSVSDPEPSR
jgi:hypothetical protein